MQNFENLDIWKRSCQLAVKIYQSLKTCEDKSFKDQICRAAVSVPSNIAEGCARASATDFCHFLSIASGSLAEMRTQLYLAVRIGFLTEKEATVLIEENKEITAMIAKFRITLKKA